MKVFLCFPNETDSFVLHTDTSSVGIGATLYVIRGETEISVAFYANCFRMARRIIQPQSWKDWLSLRPCFTSGTFSMDENSWG